jgi:hypothetical protein
MSRAVARALFLAAAVAAAAASCSGGAPTPVSAVSVRASRRVRAGPQQCTGPPYFYATYHGGSTGFNRMARYDTAGEGRRHPHTHAHQPLWMSRVSAAATAQAAAATRRTTAPSPSTRATLTSCAAWRSPRTGSCCSSTRTRTTVGCASGAVDARARARRAADCLCRSSCLARAPPTDRALSWAPSSTSPPRRASCTRTPWLWGRTVRCTSPTRTRMPCCGACSAVRFARPALR